MPDVEQRIKILSEIKDPFGRIPNIIIDLYGPGMGQAGWLYTLLTRFKNNDSSETFVSLKTLALTGGMTEKTVKAWGEHLAALGVIRIIKDETYVQEKRRARPNTYIILLPPLPPPQALVDQHFPPGWTPPERALKAIQKTSIYLTSETTPQEEAAEEGVGENSTPTPSNPCPTGGGVEENSSPSRGKEGPHKGQDLPPNKPLETRGSKQEETTTAPPATPSVVVEEFHKSTLKTLKQFDPNVDDTDMALFYKTAFEIKGSFEGAKAYIEEKIRVAREQVAKITDFVPWFKTALTSDFHTRGFYQEQKNRTEASKKKAAQDEKERQREAYEKEYAENLEKRKKAGLDDLVKEFKDHPRVLGKDRIIRVMKAKYEGINPHWEEALKIYEREG